MSRHVHEFLDVAGRPLGEGRSAAFQHVQTEMSPCPYAGGRHHHAKPMNRTALRELPPWRDVLTMLSWLGQRYRAGHETAITTYDDLAQVTGAGIFLADFLVLREHSPVRSGEIPLQISGLYKVCLGFQLAYIPERFADTAAPGRLPDSAEFYAYLEANELLIGEAEVCSGSAAMIMQAYEAIIRPHEIAQQALLPLCAGLEIAWEQFDGFTHHAAGVWRDLALYVMEASTFCPELTDSRLPEQVRLRLNACLKQHWTQLLEGQTGLVVEIARAAQDYADGRQSRPPLAPSSVPQPGGLAASVLAWLGQVAAADLQAHAPLVANALAAQLAPYDICEATVLDGVNEHLSGLMLALGLARPSAGVTASALSRVCGRTPRDWGATS
jgi:hypothetical protein